VAPSAQETVAERIRAYAGLDPPSWLLEARLADRAAALGLPLNAYLARAIGNDAAAGHELEALSEMLRVGETRFFRHRAQVATLRGHVIPERVRAARLAGRRLRGWSAGCATGEEAWTLAMLLDEARADYEVLGTDLSEDALVQARSGVYPADRTTDVPEAIRATCFQPDTARPTVAARLHERVGFLRHNLLGKAPPGRFDLVLCRNVLIYFDADTRAEVIERLAHAILPGGYLFLGYSETLRDHLELFEEVRHGEGVESVLWRRRDESISQRRALSQTPTAASPLVESPSEPPPFPTAVPRVTLRGDYHDAERLAAELKPVIAARRAIVDLDGAEYLGEDAARVLARAIMAAPELELTASRPAVRRWLERNGLVRVNR
jgi:chemotaxis methyl-accepting protein methylase